jgi:ankyrin repeat protein
MTPAQMLITRTLPTLTYAQIIADAKQKRKDKQSTLLCAACAKGDIDALRRLMAVADLDLDAGDYDDRRPIHLAACTGNITAIQMLTAARADVNVRDRMGSTPLHEALVHKQAEAATLLISTGAERLYPQIADRLCYVSSLADGVEELRFLVAFETRSVSATNYDGRTGLHLAAAEGRVETVRMLLENGASVNARDKRGCTPLLVSALSPPRCLLSPPAVVSLTVCARCPHHLAPLRNRTPSAAGTRRLPSYCSCRVARWASSTRECRCAYMHHSSYM